MTRPEIEEGAEGQRSRWLSKRTYVLVTVLVAVAVRVLYALLDVPDYWGDGFHNWMIERLTLAEGWVYTDYKGREVVWLPLFRYLGVAAMALTGRNDLLPGHLVSFVMGTAACGVTAVVATRVTGRWRWGLMAGIVLALNPWHIAYSWMNMPEATGTLIVALLLWAVLTPGRTAWLPILACLGALTRNDLLYFILLTGLWFGWRREWRRASLVAIGALAGLALWSWWTWRVTGDPLWWLLRRAAGSTDDAAFWVERGVRPMITPATLFLTTLQTFTPILILLPTLVMAWRSREWRNELPERAFGALTWLAAAFLALVGIMQVRFFSSPDPRYLVAVTPALTVLTVLVVAAAPRRIARTRAALVLAGVVVVSAGLQLPTFRFRGFTLERDRVVGEFMSRWSPSSWLLWVDAPVAIYYSGMDPARFRSSDQLSPHSITSAREARSAALASIKTNDIRYIYYDEVPYSRVHELWPAMSEGEPFEDGGISFSPVFRYDPWTPTSGEPGLASRLRARIEGTYGPAILWAVEPSQPEPADPYGGGVP